MTAHSVLLIAQPVGRRIITKWNDEVMKCCVALLILATALAASAPTLRAQPADHWSIFKKADGVAENACVSVTIGAGGNVLVRHLKSGTVTALDGYEVTTIPAPGTNRHRVYESPGGQLWTVAPGGLQEFRDGEWVLHRVPEIAEYFRGGSTNPIPFCPVRHGRVLLLFPDRLQEFDADELDTSQTVLLRRADQTALGSFRAMSLARDGGLWISGARGFAKIAGPLRNLKPDGPWAELIPPADLQLQNFHAAQEEESGGLTALAESAASHKPALARWDGQRWTARALPVEKLHFAWRGSGKTWMATSASLFELEDDRTEATACDDVPVRRIFDVAVAPDGAFWLATANGLFRHAPALWETPRATKNITSPVHAFVEDTTGNLWFVSGSALHRLRDGSPRGITGPKPSTDAETSMPRGEHAQYALPPAVVDSPRAILALFALKDGTLALSANEKLFRFEPNGPTFSEVQPPDSRPRLKALGQLKDGSLYVHSSTGTKSGSVNHVEIFDGQNFKPFPLAPPEAAAREDWNTFFAAQNGDVWLGGPRSIAWLHERTWHLFVSTNQTEPEDVVAFAEFGDGRMVCATPEKVWEFDGKNWLSLRVGFDRINALGRTRDGTLWVVSNNGLHRFSQGAWIANDSADGLPSAAVQAVWEDSLGRLWAGTARGLSWFRPDADTEPPKTFIAAAEGATQNFREGALVTLFFAGRDKWKFTATDRLLFSYRLDERESSPFQDIRSMSFGDLPLGKHYFQVRAMDRNGNVDTKPARLEFSVIVPWYRETRLVLILSTALGLAVFFAALAVNRHRKLLLSYAEVERKVAERTQELERASRELVHSQKMTALGTLAAGLAHDFNNILSIVKGSAQIIEDNVHDTQKIRTRVDRIKMVADQGAGIVKALLGFSRDSAEQPAVCDLNAVVDDTIRLLGDRFLREAEIHFERTPNLPDIPATRDFVQQILLNFIFNAAESMTQHKRVIIATRQMDALPVGLVLSPAPTAAYVAVSVQDFGCGILPENLPRIFEPFFTTKAFSTRRGTGLGLSMVYELAKKMGAGLAVESVVNESTTVTLILPVILPAQLKPQTHVHHASES